MAGNLSMACRVPGAAALLLTVGVARLGVPALSLSMLLAARDAADAYAAAGAVGAAYAVAVAGSQFAWGRAADRRGARRVLRAAALAHGIALALFAGLAHTRAGAPLLLIAAAVAGSCFPPMATVSRAAWRGVEDPDAQRALFALDGLTTELTLVLGPLVASLLVTVAGGPAAVAVVGAVVASGAFASAGSALLAVATPGHGSHRRVLPPARLAGLLAGTVAMAAAIGAVNVAGVAHAERAGLPAGLPLTVMACGGIAGALLWGARAIAIGRRAQLTGGLALYAGVVAAAGIVPVPAVLPLLALAGALMAPCDVLQAQLCGALAPSARLAESFAWLNSANWAGFSAGTSLSGAVVDASGAAGGFFACAAAAAAATAILAVGPRRVRGHRE